LINALLPVIESFFLSKLTIHPFHTQFHEQQQEQEEDIFIEEFYLNEIFIHHILLLTRRALIHEREREAINFT
jgi:hypothetical protein